MVLRWVMAAASHLVRRKTCLQRLLTKCPCSQITEYHSCSDEAALERRLESIDSEDAYAALLRQCADERSLPRAKEVHSHLSKSRFRQNSYLGNLLVKMYGKCGSLQDASLAFDGLLYKNVFCWTTMITAYAQNGHGKEAIQVLRRMDCEGEKPNEVTLLGILVACSSLRNLAEGKFTHQRIAACGYESNLKVGNALMNLYGKCGSSEQARSVFDRMPQKNLISYNSMMAAYVEHDRSQDAIDLYLEIGKTSLAPSVITFTIALGACSELNCLEQGKGIHASIVESGAESDVGVGTALVNMYGKCGDLDSAMRVFEKMRLRNVVTWSALIAAYAQQGHGKEAFELYRRMIREGIKPNEVTLLSVLSACATMGGFAHGREIHSWVISLGLESEVLMLAVINMYLKCKSLEDARRVFDKMRSRDLKSWIFMIVAYARQGHPEEALKLYGEMIHRGIEPDEVIYASVLSACSVLKSVADGKEIHKQVVDAKLDSNAVVGTAVVDLYSNCGNLEEARTAFGRINCKDVASWNAMIGAFVQHNQSREAIQLFYEMNLEGTAPNERTFISILEACTDAGAIATGKRIHQRIVASGYELGVVLGTGIVDMYGKSGDLEESRNMFERMPMKDLVAWTAMIAAYNRNGFSDEAMDLYQRMALEGLEPDEVTYISILSACAQAGLVDEGCNYFLSMSEDSGIAPREEHYLCVIDLLGRAGRLSEAEELVTRVSRQLGVVGWTSLLGACRTHGDVDRASRIVDKVVKLAPDSSVPYVLLASTYEAKNP